MAALHTQTKRIIIAVLVTCSFSWIFSYVAITIFANYAVGLFIWLPIVIGISSTVIFGYKNKVNISDCRSVTFFTLFVFCIGLLTFAFEGAICIIMALPIGWLFSFLGHIIGYQLIKSKIINPTVTIILLIISVPVVMGFEYKTAPENEDVKAVVTSIVINAPTEKVWENVIAFPQLEEPTELLFKAGIAYPINAKINGSGIGAIRYCNFSTGSFVEPITKWEKPYLLAFNVDEQPASMKELSFYDLQPNHLHGYFVSKQGQFKLTKLANGSTLLEGTTWYTNKIKPNLYWDLWSDYIVHKIHTRVLNHIKEQTERGL
ncbi:hypothetical protein GCM10027049_30890 [Mucilaginibacter puniceus]